MLEVFIEALKGDPLSRQHVIWVLSKPAFWFVILKWSVLAIAAVVLTCRLYKRGRIVWALVTLLGSAAVFWGVYILTYEAKGLFQTGNSAEAVLLRSVNTITSLLAIALIFWTIGKRLRRSIPRTPGP